MPPSGPSDHLLTPRVAAFALAIAAAIVLAVILVLPALSGSDGSASQTVPVVTQTGGGATGTIVAQ